MGEQQDSWEFYTSRTSSVWKERRLPDTQKYTGKKQTDKTIQLQIHATLYEKGKMIQRAELKPTED